jgi:RNA recognition motif-containing protein
MPAIVRLEAVELTQPSVEPQALQKVHIGNLATKSDEAGVRALFATHGEVFSFERPQDGGTATPAGFAFLEMTPADAATAIAAVNGQELDGQALRVSQARPRP